MYTQLRKEREEFRKRLVDLIIKKDDNRDAIPNAAEKEILRYYYYIHHGIDTVHVAPMEESWLNHIISKIPIKLKAKHGDYVARLISEVKVCVKICILIFNVIYGSDVIIYSVYTQ